MNKIRRKAISEIIEKIEALQTEMEDILSDIETVKDEESEYFENIPENLQSSERYEIAESAVENLESAYDTFDDMKSSLDDVLSSLEEATN